MVKKEQSYTSTSPYEPYGLYRASVAYKDALYPPFTPVDTFWLPVARVLLGEFSVRSFHSEHGLSPAICHNYNELKIAAIFCCTCLLGLSAHNHFSISGILLDLLLFNFTDLSTNHDLHELVSP